MEICWFHLHLDVHRTKNLGKQLMTDGDPVMLPLQMRPF